ncbi:MAG: thioredoxin family protein [Phycisphaerae bacterium]|nr:thioredoxin family protein [Phycisphaerae bacterium]
MQTTRSGLKIFSLFVLLAGHTHAALAAEDVPKPTGSPRAEIYDKTADGEKQIANALAKARRNHQRVLLQFGANWCGWCHKLHDLCKSDKEIARELRDEFLVVLIDVDKVDGKPHNAAVVEKYGNPTKHGLPVMVVLDADGKQLTTQETGSLEEGDHHDPAKVLAFLKKWRAPAPSADDLLKSALARAEKEKKAVFVQFSAPWCVWCHRLDDYLLRPEIAEVFDRAFVTVKVDVDRFRGGKEFNAKHGGENQGLPYFVILDSEGKKIGDSVAAPESNIGFPASPSEIAHFVKVVRKTAPGLSEKDLSVLEAGLSKKP